MDLSLNLITPVILCGGFAPQAADDDAGAERPKPFQKLSGNLSRFQQTLLRVSEPGQFNPPMIIADKAHQGLIEFEMEMIGVEPSALVLEPASRGTAPSVALAALVAGAFNLDGSLLIMPCDHLVRDPGGLAAAIQQGMIGARTGSLLAFGRKVASGDEEHAWIRRGAHLFDEAGDEVVDAEVYRLEEFAPKSAGKDAEAALEAGDRYRNSGMYLFPIATVLDELRVHVPDVLTACQLALVSGSSQGSILKPSEDKFAASPNISLERAVMQHTNRGGIVPTRALWSEEGVRPAASEDLLSEVPAEPGAEDVILFDAEGSHVQSAGPLTVVAGLDDVVVVNSGDALIVSARSHVGRLLEAHEVSAEGTDMHAIPDAAMEMLRQAVRDFSATSEGEIQETLPEEVEAEEDSAETETIKQADAEPTFDEDTEPELPFEAWPVPDAGAVEEPPLLLHAALESAA